MWNVMVVFRKTYSLNPSIWKQASNKCLGTTYRNVRSETVWLATPDTYTRLDGSAEPEKVGPHADALRRGEGEVGVLVSARLGTIPGDRLACSRHDRELGNKCCTIQG